MPRAAAVLLAALLTLVWSAPAVGAEGDNSRCVAKIEWQSFRGLVENTSGTRHVVEARWEVTGRGLVDLPYVGASVVYKRCGYPPASSFVAVAYDRDNHAWAGAVVSQ